MSGEVFEVGAYARQKEATARAVNDAARMAQIAARRTRELAAMTARAESAEAAHAALRAGLRKLLNDMGDPLDPRHLHPQAASLMFQIEDLLATEDSA